MTLPVFKIYGDPDEQSIHQMTEAMKHDAIYGALMADHHVGYSVPIGAAIAYKDKICVNGVGYDIGCGNKAVRIDVNADDVRNRITRVMDDIQKTISFGMGRNNNERIDHEIFDKVCWTELDLLRGLKDKAIGQLGTVGGGNHYVDIFVDELDRVWIGVHFGSRGLGHTICNHFIKLSGGVDQINAKPIVLDTSSDLGSQYIQCMEVAGEYAYAGRDWVCSRVARLLSANIMQEVHNHHNFAWQETHNNELLWVVRKGCTPNFPGILSFVGGSMGDFSFILEGVESQESKDSLYSTVHGAGRIISRMQARGKVDKKNGSIIRSGSVSRQDMESWIKRFDVELRGADVDESPHCYKRIEQVLFHHRDSVKIMHRLKPIGVAMAPPEVHDPYKD